jgi:microcin C transport system substrate-binding protein
VPPEVFTTEFTNPVNRRRRIGADNLRTACGLLQEAGWTPGNDRILRNEQGEPLEVEFLLVSPQFERIVLPYAQQLERLGIRPLVRTIDSAQYERRIQTFDFRHRGDELGPVAVARQRAARFLGLGSRRPARQPQSRRHKGPGVDYLIDRVIFAKDRDELVTATRALDRVLLWNHFVVPTWHIPYDRTARWDRFGRPDTLPDYTIGFPTIWWWDAERPPRSGALDEVRGISKEWILRLDARINMPRLAVGPWMLGSSGK